MASVYIKLTGSLHVLTQSLELIWLSYRVIDCCTLPQSNSYLEFHPPPHQEVVRAVRLDLEPWSYGIVVHKKAETWRCSVRTLTVAEVIASWVLPTVQSSCRAYTFFSKSPAEQQPIANWCLKMEVCLGIWGQPRWHNQTPYPRTKLSQCKFNLFVYKILENIFVKCCLFPTRDTLLAK